MNGRRMLETLTYLYVSFKLELHRWLDWEVLGSSKVEKAWIMPVLLVSTNRLHLGPSRALAAFHRAQSAILCFSRVVIGPMRL
jgi:hypothetical protein